MSYNTEKPSSGFNDISFIQTMIQRVFLGNKKEYKAAL